MTDDLPLIDPADVPEDHGVLQCGSVVAPDGEVVARVEKTDG